MLARPTVGLILLRAQWFDDVVALPALVEGLKADTEALIGALPGELDVRHTWVVNSPTSLQACVGELRAARLDLVLLTFQVWAEDFFLQPLVRALNGQPLAIWCFQPTAQPPRPASFVDVLRFSGPVGTLEGLGTLKNLGVPYLFLTGAPDSPLMKQELINAARAGQVHQALKTTRFGLLPAHNDQMQSTYVDEIRLATELGPVVQYLSVRDLDLSAQAISVAEIDAYLEQVRRDFPVKGVSDETLQRAARYTLGLGRLADEHRLDVLSFNDTANELHAVCGLRPCLFPPQAAGPQARLFGLEGDLGAALALRVQSLLAGGPVFFVEFWFWDEAHNLMVGGHAGLQDPQAARPGEAYISQDYEYCQTDPTEGAHFQFACRPGRVTLLQLRWTAQGVWQAIVCSGEVVDQPAWIEGYPHAVFKPDVNVLDFFRQAATVGTTQHWILAYGDVRESIAAWCKLANVSLKVIA